MKLKKLKIINISVYTLVMMELGTHISIISKKGMAQNKDNAKT